MNLDRFSQGLPDVQEAAPAGECAGCGESLYEGEEVVVLLAGKGLCHKESECLLEAEGLETGSVLLTCQGCGERLDEEVAYVKLDPGRYCHENGECLIRALGYETTFLRREET